MNCQTLLDTIRKELPLIYTCEEIASYRLRLNTPFLYPNGDYIDLYLEETPAGLYLTDLGETLGYLSDHGISFRHSPKRQKTLDDILLTHGAEQFQGELRIRLDIMPRDLAWAITRLGQAAIQLADLAYTMRLGALATFREEVEEFWIAANIPYEANYRVVGGSGEVHTVDFYLPQRRPVLAETLSSATSSYASILTSKVVRVWHDILRVDGRYQYLSILDDASDVWRPEWIDQIAQLSAVVVWSERDRIRDMLSA